MKPVIISCDRTNYLLITFARQTSQPNAKKASSDDTKICHVSIHDYVAIACNINRHIGKKADGSRCHASKGFGDSEAGECIVGFAETNYLALVIVRFNKRFLHLVIFYSGSTKMRMNYIVIRCRHFLINIGLLYDILSGGVTHL